MAQVHGRYKWVATWMVFIMATSTVYGCSSDSRELHICLNIYLERDFPLVETIVKGLQRQGRYGSGRVILEGPDLQKICSDILDLHDCFAPLQRECESLWEYDLFSKMIVVLGATHQHLCGNNTDNIRDILLNSGCLARTRIHVDSCPGFDWFMSWRQVLRLQITPSESCKALQWYRNCLQQRLTEDLCGLEASRVYLSMLDVWLKEWCGMGSSEDKRYLYSVYNGT